MIWLHLLHTEEQMFPDCAAFSEQNSLRQDCFHSLSDWHLMQVETVDGTFGFLLGEWYFNQPHAGLI